MVGSDARRCHRYVARMQSIPWLEPPSGSTIFLYSDILVPLNLSFGDYKKFNNISNVLELFVAYQSANNVFVLKIMVNHLYWVLGQLAIFHWWK